MKYECIFAVMALFYEDITAFMELIQKQRSDEAEKDIKRKRMTHNLNVIYDTSLFAQ